MQRQIGLRTGLFDSEPRTDESIVLDDGAELGLDEAGNRGQDTRPWVMSPMQFVPVIGTP